MSSGVITLYEEISRNIPLVDEPFDEYEVSPSNMVKVIQGYGK
ncbi:MAG: hypothetical protein ACI9RO_000612 [Alteromonas macleodii]|jgi:hypothetical protein|tara:strand:- start:401 stop:529 length:129 start_codon:yes stop_codon:yes gene_type:complete